MNCGSPARARRCGSPARADRRHLCGGRCPQALLQARNGHSRQGPLRAGGHIFEASVRWSRTSMRMRALLTGKPHSRMMRRVRSRGWALPCRLARRAAGRGDDPDGKCALIRGGFAIGEGPKSRSANRCRPGGAGPAPGHSGAGLGRRRTGPDRARRCMRRRPCDEDLILRGCEELSNAGSADAMHWASTLWLAAPGASQSARRDWPHRWRHDMLTDPLKCWPETRDADVRRWPREALDPLRAGPPDRAAIAAALRCARDTDPDARARLKSSVVTIAEVPAPPDGRRALARLGTFRVPPPAAAAPTRT